jgi:hypothetical protein
LTRNPSITFKDIFDHPNLPWDWEGLSNNPSISFQNVLDYPDNEWDWWHLSRNPSITFQNVIDHPDKPWDWEGLSENPSITWKNVLDHPNKRRNWQFLSQKRDGVFIKYNRKRIDLGLEEELYFPSKEMIEEIDEKWLHWQYRIGGEIYNNVVNKL